MRLQRLAQPFAGSWANHKCVEVIEALKARFTQIRQPSAERDNDWSSDPQAVLEETRNLLGYGDLTLYSDDAVYRGLVTLDRPLPPAMCTLDLLNLAEVQGLLTLRAVAERVSQLVKWNVTVVIANRQLIAAVPDKLDTIKSIAEGVDILQGDQLVAPMLEGIWNVRKPYEAFQDALVNVMVPIIGEPASKVESAAALWGVWYLKAKLRSEPTVIPPLRHAAFAMVRMAAKLANRGADIGARLWQAKMLLVQLEFGPRMDEQKEREAVELVASVTADVESQLKKGSAALMEWLSRGLMAGTAAQSWFLAAYSQRLIKIGREAR
jgi:hypothetical protein